MPKARSKIVVIGGGTGSFAVLSGLKQYASNITALVNMVDDGGSTGVLRDELGALPPGDVRQCLVALSRSPRLRELFSYRFEEGAFRGHPFGNIFLSALEQVSGNFAQAVNTAGEVLNIQGRVLPITLEDVQLVLDRHGAEPIVGQRTIEDSNATAAIKHPKVRLDQPARINPEAERAILQAEMIVIAPGDIYTSLGPTLLVEGVADALDRAAAKVVYVSNLLTRQGQEYNLTSNEIVHELERLAGMQFIDYVIYNDHLPTDELLGRYGKPGEQPILIDQAALEREGRKVISADVIADTGWKGGQEADPLSAKRSIIRHDQDKVAKQIMGVLRA